MGTTNFEIEIYGRQDIPQDRLVEVVRRLPLPLQISGLSRGVQFEDLLHPSRKEEVKRFSDWNVYQALVGSRLYFGECEEDGGFVDVWLAPCTRLVKDTAIDVYKNCTILPELKRRKMQNWKHLSSVMQENGRKEKLDRRIFDFGEIIVKTLIPRYAENNYMIILLDQKENLTINTKKEFLGQLDRLVEENCTSRKLLQPQTSVSQNPCGFCR